MAKRIDNRAMQIREIAMFDQAQCWQAICERDASQDGRFVFAVSTTGIYCRPSCPARRPRRGNVSFHVDAASAEAAGYRPCKRCSPQGKSPAEQLDDLVIAACRLLEGSTRPPTLARLAARIGLSASHLARAFKARTGMTPRAWFDICRRQRLEVALPHAGSVLQAALEAGYADTRALYQQPAALSPARRRRQGAGETLRYAIGDCPLGLLLLAVSEHGACALLFGDDEAALEAELRQRFAAAQLIHDQQGLHDWLYEALAQAKEPSRAARLPLDMRGTAFQQRVWQALRDIPPGQTRGYGELAEQLGSHARAVARACASNPLGLLVPCHRVIGANGTLAGYRWGVPRKRALLEKEGAPIE